MSDATTITSSVLLVRHGQSLWNARARWQGTADIALSTRGRRQAQVAAEVLADGDVIFAAVYTSDLKRAAETGRIIASHLGLTPAHIDHRWREAHAGEWEGMTPDEIKREWRGYLEQNRRPPGFEPADTVAERTMAAAADVLRRHAGGAPALVATHSGVIRVIRRHLGGHGDRTPNLGGLWLHDTPAGIVLGDTFDPGAAPASSGFAEDPGPETTTR
ncbi:MAG: histidine phosphatase family protein [Ilumatobacteraceae bacterium]|nr:histidine phosphatase family protein [Ilumatobacteraceae bacterium]